LATAYGERWEAGDRAVFAIGRKPIGVEKARPFSVVILSANYNNLIQCVNAVIKNEPDLPEERIIVVDDGLYDRMPPFFPRITWIKGSKPFVFARNANSRNANIGIATANSGVILLNDDAILLTKYGFTEISKRHGIVSAAIKGIVGNRNQLPKGAGLRPELKRLCFIAVFIPKSVQDKLGPLDERFTGYGYDDDDYSRRAIEVGIPLSIFDGCIVDHGSLIPTFRSKPGWDELMRKNAALFLEKYSSPAQR
jgi:GT2 family glycosyltransferase